ncbi:MAG: IS481 family transposase, partial [Pseudomonadota bacterium]
MHKFKNRWHAFGVSRRTLYRWKARLAAEGGHPAALVARSCAPKGPRQPRTDPRLVAEIRHLRTR